MNVNKVKTMLGLTQFGDMAGFLNGLTGADGVTSANMWSQVTPAAATIGAIVIFAFGYYVVRKIVKGASRGKARI